MNKCMGWGLTICNNDKGNNLLYCPSCASKEYKKKEELKQEGIEEGCFEDEDEITCPYCGYKDRDSWEAPDEDDEYECSDCGRAFQMVRNVTVTYSTYRIEQEDAE